MSRGDLALHGAAPVRESRPWPQWPVLDDASRTAVLRALEGGRWAISWSPDGSSSEERAFAAEFAEYLGAGSCVCLDHGSSALVAAFEALGVGPGDEVVIPVQTWVAPATAVLRVGALPVFADVNPVMGCVSADSVRACLSASTRAVVVVHLACSVAPVEGIVEVACAAGVPVIEDCSQAHGAMVGTRCVGTFGAVGVFSFQAAKTLTCGEGGALVTSDQELARRVEMLRADARHFAAETDGLVESGEITGSNYCLTDHAAALLRAQLAILDDQRARRERNARVLEGLLDTMPEFSSTPPGPSATRRSFYEYGIQLGEGLSNVPVTTLATALNAELGLPVYPPRDPLYRSLFFRPWTKARFRMLWERHGDRAFASAYPGADRYAARTLLLHHSVFLSEESDMEDVARALEKVAEHVPELSR